MSLSVTQVRRNIVARELAANWWRLVRYDNPEAGAAALQNVAYEVVKALEPTIPDDPQ